MASEQELKELNPLHKEFQNLLDQDFKDRKLKENEMIKATVTEITKNFVVVDCKAKMEGMIPIEEFKNDDELAKLKVKYGNEINILRDDDEITELTQEEALKNAPKKDSDYFKVPTVVKK